MVDIVAANGPRMKCECPHLRRPSDNGQLRGTDLIGVPTRRELDPCGLHVVGGPAWDALLVEGVATTLLARRQDDAGMHALRPALERRWPPLESAHDAVADGEEVLDDVELGEGA
jgi:hypothetical protein